MPQQEELQCGGSKSAKARGASRWWQKWEFESKLPSPPPFLFFAFFSLQRRWQQCHHRLLMSLLTAKKKMTTMPSSFFSSFFLFFATNKHYFFPNITPVYLGWGNDGTKSINFPSCNSNSTFNNKTYYCKIEAREL